MITCFKCWKLQRTLLKSVVLYNKTSISYMKSWEIKEYGGNECLKLNVNKQKPYVSQPDDVIIEVNASSLNPIDLLMRGGYGNSLLNVLRQTKQGSLPCPKGSSEFPLTLGRDCSGKVVHIGRSVLKFRKGDEVWVALPPFNQGAQTQYMITSAENVSLKPAALDHINSAALPYVSVTCWNALCSVGGLSEHNAADKKILVIGGSGGLGTTAIQILKSWNAFVAATCSTDAVDTVTSLGADVVVDYKTQNLIEELRGGFDFVFDTIGNKSTKADGLRLLRPWMNAKYVTVVTPVMKKADEHGIPLGLAYTAGTLLSQVLEGFTEGKHVRWSLFRPNGKALSKIAEMVNKGKITPVIDSIFDFDDLPEAFNKLERGHLRGKIIIKHSQ